MQIPLGFDGTNLLLASAGAPGVPIASDVLDRVQRIPGVASAGIADSLPLSGADGELFEIQGLRAEADSPVAQLRTVAVDERYFGTLRIPLLAGRAFESHDMETAQSVAVINATMAREYFSESNPLGRRIRLADEPDRWREIVGVVGDIRQRNLEEDSRPIAYRPWRQLRGRDLSLAVRVQSAADLEAVRAALRAVLKNASAKQAWEPLKTMQEFIADSESISLRRPILEMLAAFGSIALLLAAVGVYGVVSYSVARRTKEIGLRMALGATRHSVIGLILAGTTRLLLAGLACGAALALLASRLLPEGHVGWSGSGILLIGVERTDLATYCGVALLLSLVALCGSCLPALRAASVDPMTALREE